MRIVSFVLFLFFCCSCKKEITDEITLKSKVNRRELESKLIAINSNNSIDFLNQITQMEIITQFGKPITIEQENVYDLYSSEPWTILKYNGLEIVLEGNHLAEITISNKDWKISDFKIGDNENILRSKLKPIEKKYKDYNIYLFPNLDGVFFSKINKRGKVIELRVSNPT